MKQTVIALGFFDGVHLGHGQLLRKARKTADVLGVPAAALTFDSHPDTLVSGVEVPLLSSPQDREYLMKHLYGIDALLTLRFDAAMRDMPWERFLTEILIGTYHACYLVCGHDFRFGAGGLGTAARLRERCGALGLGCQVIPEYRLEGVTVSSTYIRELIGEGQMEKAVRYLGHPHILSGTVVQGKQIGRTIDIPTANLRPSPSVLTPCRGVYACRAWVNGASHIAITNVGLRPTVNGDHLTIEPWLLDFKGDLYGQEMRLEFWKFLRPERKFPSLEALREEILRNAMETRAFFSGIH